MMTEKTYTLQEIEEAWDGHKGPLFPEELIANLTKPKIEFAEGEVIMGASQMIGPYKPGQFSNHYYREPNYCRPLKLEEMSQQVRDLYEVISHYTWKDGGQMKPIIEAFEKHHGINREDSDEQAV